MNGVEKINEKIKLLKQKLDFFDKLKTICSNGATGYELTYETEQFQEYFGYFTMLMITRNKVKNMGNSKVSDNSKVFDGFMRYLKKLKLEYINDIGYLEFLKQKPKPKEIKEKIEYEKDLDDFIGFLDEKFKEWEQEIDWLNQGTGSRRALFWSLLQIRSKIKAIADYETDLKIQKKRLKQFNKNLQV